MEREDALARPTGTEEPMGFEPQHARNCPAVWRGFHLTLFERIPEDAPCMCGAEAKVAARAESAGEELPARAA